MELRAVIAGGSVMDWKPGAHASRCGGNPVCIAASLATLRLLEDKYMDNARRVGEFILHRTADWTERVKNVGEVRGKGLMIGIGFVRDQKTNEKDPDLRNTLIQAAFRKGLLVIASG